MTTELPKDWSENKRKAYERLISDKEIGYLDPDIFDVLMSFFNIRGVYTKSSCSGRITIVDSSFPWERRGSSIIYKDHFGIRKEDVLRVLRQGAYRRLWLISQGPIMHIYSEEEESAWKIISTARSVGFKHSGILSKNNKGIVVELTTGIRIVHFLQPLYLSDDVSLERLVDASNSALALGKERLQKLREKISEI